jgi:hypothetical protein
MAKITGTFDKLWNQGMADDARRLGVVDGDLSRVRSKVKNLLIDAGWAKADGAVEFVTEQDAANALQAAHKVLTSAAASFSAQRKVVKASVGHSPTRAQVLSGSTISSAVSNDPVTVNLTSANTVDAGSFNPEMGKVGDRCPRCHGSMEPVGLVNDRAGLYCPRDRVVSPLPAGTQVRY